MKMQLMTFQADANENIDMNVNESVNENINANENMNEKVNVTLNVNVNQNVIDDFPGRCKWRGGDDHPGNHAGKPNISLIILCFISYCQTFSD